MRLDFACGLSRKQSSVQVSEIVILLNGYKSPTYNKICYFHPAIKLKFIDKMVIFFSKISMDIMFSHIFGMVTRCYGRFLYFFVPVLKTLHQ